MEERIYTSLELAEAGDCARITVLKWAEKNGVKFAGEGVRKIYLFSKADLQNFLNRRGPGRMKKE